MNRESAYHLALHVSYPSSADVQIALADGVDPGGLIMIHGLPKHMALIGRFHRFVDWTKGCIALTNPEVDEIARVVPISTPIELLP